MKTLLLLLFFISFTFGCTHKPSTTDTVDRQAVRVAVRNSLPAFKSCYEEEFKKDATLNGKVNVAWEIHDGGKAKNVHIVPEKTTLINPTVQDCVVKTMSQIQFPEPPEGTVAEVSGYPFVFSKQ